MKKNIYLVVHSSYLDSLYTEVTIHTDYEKAVRAFETDIEDIKESTDGEEEDEYYRLCEYPDGRKKFNFFDPFSNHEYRVSLEIREL